MFQLSGFYCRSFLAVTDFRPSSSCMFLDEVVVRVRPPSGLHIALILVVSGWCAPLVLMHAVPLSLVGS